MISDGRIERDSRSSLRRLMREMVEQNILLVMIVVEGGKNDKERRRDSIVHMKEVTFAVLQVKELINQSYLKLTTSR